MKVVESGGGWEKVKVAESVATQQWFETGIEAKHMGFQNSGNLILLVLNKYLHLQIMFLTKPANF